MNPEVIKHLREYEDLGYIEDRLEYSIDMLQKENQISFQLAQELYDVLHSSEFLESESVDEYLRKIKQASKTQKRTSLSSNFKRRTMNPARELKKLAYELRASTTQSIPPNHKISIDEDEDAFPGPGDEFYVLINNEFVGRLIKDEGKWYEESIQGKTPYGWSGKRYMSYLKRDDILSWLRKDYDSVKDFDTEDAALDELENLSDSEDSDDPEEIEFQRQRMLDEAKAELERNRS